MNLPTGKRLVPIPPDFPYEIAWDKVETVEDLKYILRQLEIKVKSAAPFEAAGKMHLLREIPPTHFAIVDADDRSVN